MIVTAMSPGRHACRNHVVRCRADQYQRAQVFELADASVDGNGLQPGLRDAGWDELRALAYGNRL
jgi:hypothetical protein